MEIREQYLRLRNSRKNHNQDTEERERKESNRREETPFDDINEEILGVAEQKRIVTSLVSVPEKSETPKSILIPNVGNSSKLVQSDENVLQNREKTKESILISNLTDVEELALKRQYVEKLVQRGVEIEQKAQENKQKPQQTPKEEKHIPTRNMSVSKKPEKKKEVLFEIVIDGTLSFTMVYPKVFYILENFLHIAKEVKKEYRGVVFQYGLTVFHEEDDVLWVDFGGEKYFTESETELIEKLSNIEFYGGSETGREDFTSALDQTLRVLNNHGEEQSSRGILFFSDSIPEKDKLEPDFTEMVQDGYLNKGLRFAQFYTGTDDFCPKMLMVNGDGNLAGDAKNESSYECLENILRADPNKVSQELKEMVNNILNQTSILM